MCALCVFIVAGIFRGEPSVNDGVVVARADNAVFFGVELCGGGDDEERSSHDERNKESERQIKARELAVSFAPATLEQGVGQKESHVDAHGGTKGADDDVALAVRDVFGPEAGVFASGGNGFVIAGGGFEQG